jgi:hypothetical protein
VLSPAKRRPTKNGIRVDSWPVNFLSQRVVEGDRKVDTFVAMAADDKLQIAQSQSCWVLAYRLLNYALRFGSLSGFRTIEGSLKKSKARTWKSQKDENCGSQNGQSGGRKLRTNSSFSEFCRARPGARLID